MPPFIRRHPYTLAAVGGVILLNLVILWMVFFTLASLRAVRSGNFEVAAQHSLRVLPPVKALSAVTLHQVPDIELWRLGLLFIAEAPTTLSAITQNVFASEILATSPSLKTMSSQLVTLGSLYTKSWLVSRVTPQYNEEVATAMTSLEIVRETLLTGDQSLVVLFQNTHEVRGTGGFTGSYALVKLDEGQLTSLEIFDIYQTDGQFEGYVSAPPGVEEFLSGGRGLRLPDANWWPDFPLSAQRVLAFMALGKTQTLDGVIALNLDLVEDLLLVTGPVYLPDYQTEVTQENLADVLRSNREEFFPGSVAKQHQLSSFFTQFKLKLAELEPSQQLSLLRVIASRLPTKELQLYSSNDTLQQLLVESGVAGLQQTALSGQPASTDIYFYPVESNVGINKANRDIQRSYYLELGSESSGLDILFSNQAESKLNYVNYQRLYILPEHEVTSITYQGKTIENWDEDIVTTTSGDLIKQIGFLVTLLPESTGLLSIKLSHPPIGEAPYLVFQKQSGIPPSPLTITTQGVTDNRLLESDLGLQLR